MKKITQLKCWHASRVFLIALTMTAFSIFSAKAQTSDYSFNSFSNGDFIGVVDTSWTTWSGTTGGAEDAIVDSAMSKCGGNSLRLELASTDALFLMGDQTSGTWETGFSIYVPTGSSGYYNIQETEVAGVNWMMEGFFDGGGVGSIDVGAGNQVATFTYRMDNWVDVRHYIDLTNDSIQIYIDGAFIYAGEYTANPSNPTSTLGSYDFFPAGGAGPLTLHYIDDMVFRPGTMPAIGDNSIDYWAAGDTIGEVDDNWGVWGTIANDAFVSTTQAQSGTNSVELTLAATDALYLMGDQTTGTWEAGYSIYVATGQSAYYNIQSDEAPGLFWMIDGWFDDGGTGYYEVGAGNQVATFTYPMDTWVDVRHYIDVDNDSIQVFVDGNFVYAGQYTANATSPPSKIGSYDFWPSGGNGPGTTYYVDDFVFNTSCLKNLDPPLSDWTFEAWADGDTIGQVDTSWATWGTVANDAFVSTAQAQSGTKSLELSLAATDALFLMGDKTTGTWKNGFSIYVATGQSAYYNIQSDEAPGLFWMIDGWFDDGGTGYYEVGAGNQVATFNYSMDTWVDVVHYIDLDADSIQVFVQDSFVYAGVYTANATGPPSKLGAYDFWPSGGNGPGTTYYVDDMVHEPGTLQPVPVGLEDRFTLDFNMFPNPAENTVTIVNDFNGEIYISIKDAVGRTHQTTNSSLGSIQMDVSALNAGIYFVEIQHQDRKGISKLVIR